MRPKKVRSPETRILFVDDEQFQRKVYSEMLAEDGHTVKTAASAEEALPLIKDYNWDIVLTDYILPEMDGLELAKLTKDIKPNIDVIIITAHGTIESAVEALKFGISDYLLKPVNPEELKLTVKRLIGLRRVVKENVQLKSTNELMRVLNRLSLCLEPDYLMHTAVNLLNNFMNGDASVYLQFLRDKNEYMYKFSTGLSRVETQMLPGIVNKLHNGWKNRFRKTRIVRSPIIKMNLKKISHNLSSFLIIPVFMKKNFMGVLILIKKKKMEKFTQSSLKVAKIAAKHLTLTLENCQKFIRARELAFIDELTGLYNTRYLDYFMESEIKRAHRQNYPLSFLFLDIDHFKKVNDTHGHLIGSKLLIEAGKLIKSCVRDIDIIIRYGGDEYIIILVNTPPEGAMMVGERLRLTIKNHTFMKNEKLNIRVTGSFGIATYPVHASSKEQVIDLADRAMYKAKTSTRDAVYIANELLKSAATQPKIE